MWWKKKRNTPERIERSAQLYELHAEGGKTRIEQWMEGEPESIITVITPDLNTALSYLNWSVPGFKIRTITEQGDVLLILEKSNRRKIFGR